MVILFFTLSWFLILKRTSDNIRFKDALVSSFLSLFYDLIIPSASIYSEYKRVEYLHKVNGLDYGSVVACVAVHRLINCISLSISLIISVLVGYLQWRKLKLKGYLLSSTIILVMALFALFMTLKPKYIVKIYEGLKKHSRRVAESSRLKNFIDNFTKAGLQIKGENPLFIILIFTLSTIRWYIGALIFYIVLKELGVIVSLWKCLILFVIYNMVMFTPTFIPAMIGALESTLTLTMIFLGISKAVAGAAALLIRIVITGTMLLILGIPALYYDIKMSKYYS